MFKIAVSINKGGVGKTTLVRNISVAAYKAGLNVVVLDLDSQQNLTSWGRTRKEKQSLPLPIVKFTAEKNMEDEIETAENAGCDLLIIDTPPGRSTEALAAVEAADLVLIPFWNEQDAYEGAAKTTVVARRLGKEAIGILNFAQPNSLIHEQAADSVLKAMELPMCPIVFHKYNDHPLARPKGLTAQEYAPDGIAALEIINFWAWLVAAMQDRTSAIVHKSTIKKTGTK